MATGKDFKITLPITGFVTRSYTDPNGTENNVLVIKGIASDASRDQYNGQMSPDCIIGMADTINGGAGAPVYHNVQRAEQASSGPVRLDVDHSDHWTDQIGMVTRAEVVNDLTPEMKQAGYVAPLLMVEAEVDLDMSHGRDLARALQKNAQLGMSVWGYVKEGKIEVNRSTGEKTEHFNKVDLRKIAITSKPVNKNTWVQEVRRSMTGVEMPEEEVTPQAETPADAPAEAAVARAEDIPAQPVVDPDMPQGLSEALAAASLPVTSETEQASSDTVARAEEVPAEAVTESGEGNPEEVVARAEEQPEEAAATTEEAPAEEVVERSEVTEEAPVEETVQRSEVSTPDLDTIVAAVLERLGPKPDMEPLSRSMNEHGEVIRSLPGMFEAVNVELSRAVSTIDTMQKTITSLQGEIEAMKAKLQERTGRKGIVARAEDTLGTGKELTKEDISYVVRELAKTDKVAAMNVLLGRVALPEEVAEPVKIPEELLNAPDNSPVS